MNSKGTSLAMAAALLLFASCEKDVLENGGKGKKVEIFFSMSTTDYRPAADVMRSKAVREPMTRTIALNDELYLRATLASDPEDALRATAPFINGQKLCFMAFNATTQDQVDAKIYSYSTAEGRFVPDGDPLMVEPDDGTVYRFAAYSYFGESGATLSASDVDPVHDLVYGKTAMDQTITDTESGRTVAIHMTHQLARVRVRVLLSSLSASVALSGVKLEGGRRATLTPFDGSISWGAEDVPQVLIASVSSSSIVTSVYRTVTPVSANPVVRIESLTVSGKAFANKRASFDVSLDAGASYTLVVDVKKGAAFAYSNIYWDGTKMTFDTTDKGHQGYQGLFFKFGSLVGISPAQTTGSDAFSSTATPIYKAGQGAPTYGSWSSIPSDENSSPRDPDISVLKGDICKYINPLYRMPGYTEFGAAEDWSAGTGSNPGGVADEAAGTRFFTSGRKYDNSGIGGYFPRSGSRNYNTGALEDVASNGWYWSRSFNVSEARFALSFSSSTLITNQSRHREHAFPVRCIRD
jgi:hypothetical protein